MAGYGSGAYGAGGYKGIVADIDHGGGTIHYAVEIDTGTSYTNATYGIQSGVIRYITDRPGYDGVTIVPTWGPLENSSGNITDVWYEGFITRDGISTIKRGFGDEVEKTGGYARGGKVSVKVDGALSIKKSLESQSVYLAGSEMTVYLVVNDVFYQQWNGIIDSITGNYKASKINGIADYTKRHKVFPPLVANEESYDSVSDNSKDKTIPVCLGDCNYAATVTLKDNFSRVALVEYEGEDYTSCPATHYSTSGMLRLYTKGKTFSNGELRGGTYFIRAIAGGDAGSGAPETDRIYLIKNNFATISDQTDILPATFIKNLPSVAVSTDPFYTAGSGYTPTGDEWFFEIINIDFRFAVSTNDIKEYKLSEYGLADVKTWDSTRKKFLEVSPLVTSDDTTTSNAIGHPNINLKKATITKDGEYTTSYYHSPELALTGLGDGSILTDRDRSTYLETPLRNSPVDSDIIIIKIPDEVIENNYDKIMILVDFDIVNLTKGDPVYTLELTPRVGSEIYDNIYGKRIAIDVAGEYVGSSISANPLTVYDYNFLPNTFYDNGGNDNGETSLYAVEDVEDNYFVTGNTLDLIKSDVGSLRYGLYIGATATGSGYLTWNVRFKQVGIVGIKSINLFNDTFYSRLSGEELTGNETNTISRAIQKIVFDYDDRSDYTIDEVIANRNWHFGKQFTERKSSYKHIHDICRQSFIWAYITRLNRLYFSTINGKQRAISTNNNVIRDSLSDLDSVPIRNVYNEFLIKYDYNPAKEGYNKQIGITKVSEFTTFPLETDTDSEGRLLWKQCAPGISDYSTASSLWSLCRASYEKVKTINPLPDDLSELDVYTDYNVFEPTDTTTHQGTDSSAYKYLEKCVDLLSTQRLYLEMEQPITGDMAMLDLMERVVFTDALYNESDTEYGYITNISINPSKDTIKIKILFYPDGA